MNKSAPSSTLLPESACDVNKRVILSMGGKGGVGKTSIMVGLAEWFDRNQIPVKLLDLDTENKARGSLTHFFGGQVPKVNIHSPAGLDAFIDYLSDGSPVVLADMGAGSGQVTHEWFETMYPDIADAGIAFTTIGVVTSDPASVESVLSWAARLQDRVRYLIVENCITDRTDFTYWDESEQARRFREVLKPEGTVVSTVRKEENEVRSLGKEIPLSNAVYQRIAALKQRAAARRQTSKQFRYDPGEPLHLP